MVGSGALEDCMKNVVGREDFPNAFGLVWRS